MIPIHSCTFTFLLHISTSYELELLELLDRWPLWASLWVLNFFCKEPELPEKTGTGVNLGVRVGDGDVECEVNDVIRRGRTDGEVVS
jgi:hypothetical protein